MHHDLSSLFSKRGGPAIEMTVIVRLRHARLRKKLSTSEIWEILTRHYNITRKSSIKKIYVIVITQFCGLIKFINSQNRGQSPRFAGFINQINP